MDRLDAFEHLGERVAPGQCLEAIGLEGVETHRDAMDARIAEGLGLGPEENAVGGDGQIADARLGGDHLHEVSEVLAEERLAPGEPELVHPELGEGVDEARRLLEGEDVGAGQPRVLFLGHAVGAAEIAPIGDGHAQVAQRPPERVADHGSST